MSKLSVLLPISLAISLLSGNVLAECSINGTDVKVIGLQSIESTDNFASIYYIIEDGNNTKDFCRINTMKNPRAYQLIKTAYLTGQPVALWAKDKLIFSALLGRS